MGEVKRRRLPESEWWHRFACWRARIVQIMQKTWPGGTNRKWHQFLLLSLGSSRRSLSRGNVRTRNSWPQSHLSALSAGAWPPFFNVSASRLITLAARPGCSRYTLCLWAMHSGIKLFGGHLQCRRSFYPLVSCRNLMGGLVTSLKVRRNGRLWTGARWVRGQISSTCLWLEDAQDASL